MNKIKIGLFGFGVVGQGIFQVLSKSRNAHAEIVKICVRSNKPRSIDASYFTTDPEVILSNPEIDLIVEVIDDAAASYKIVKAALQKGIPVVSGNKAMLARHLPELIDLQKKHNVALLYDASSCGSIPVIRNLEEYYDNDLLLEVKGILNGSSNYILSRVFDHQESYDAALAQAQALGFAESDPSFDIEGYDSLFKLVIITVHALGVYVHPDRIFTYGISTIHDSDIRYAREKGVKIKLVAQVVKVSDRKFTMFVMPEFVTPGKYIYSVDDEYNGVVIRGECYDRQFMFGKGAGQPAYRLVDPERHHGPSARLPVRIQETALPRPSGVHDRRGAESLCAIHGNRRTENPPLRPHHRAISGRGRQLRDRLHPPFGAARQAGSTAGQGRFHGRFPELLPRAGSLEPKDRPPSNERLPNFRFGRRSFFRATNYLLERDHRLRRIVIGIGEDISPTLFRLTTVTPQILEYIIIIDRRVVMCVVIRRVRPTVVLVITDTISESKPPIVENNRHFPNVT